MLLNRHKDKRQNPKQVVETKPVEEKKPVKKSKK